MTLFAERCGGSLSTPVELSAFTGSLSSENYPDNYHNNVDCFWRISVPSTAILLEFPAFLLASDGADYIKVRK